VLRGQKPLMLDKMDYTTHPLAKKLKPQQLPESLWAQAAVSADKEPNIAEEPKEDKFW